MQKLPKTMQIIKENKEAVIRIPLWQKENNSYMDDKDLGEVPSMIGVITRAKNRDNNYYISHLCDLSYKGTQQEGMPIINFYNEEELRDACKTLGLQIWEREKYKNE